MTKTDILLEDLFEIDSNIRKQVKEKIYKC